MHLFRYDNDMEAIILADVKSNSGIYPRYSSFLFPKNSWHKSSGEHLTPETVCSIHDLDEEIMKPQEIL